jgi:hypothetical protein
MNMPIFVFYHVYAFGDWVPLVTEQLYKVKNSGLYDECLAMFVSFIGDEKAIEKYYELISDFKKIHTSKADNINNKEYDAIHSLWYCVKDTFPYILNGFGEIDVQFFYFHTKGIHSGRELPHIATRMNDWRLMMEYFLIENWKTCSELLNDKDTDAVGCNYREQDLFGVWRGHFSGNFWASKSSYLIKLPEPQKESATWDVLHNEFWIGFEKPRVKILHESHIDHYNNNYSSENYL